MAGIAGVGSSAVLPKCQWSILKRNCAIPGAKKKFKKICRESRRDRCTASDNLDSSLLLFIYMDQVISPKARIDTAPRTIWVSPTNITNCYFYIVVYFTNVESSNVNTSSGLFFSNFRFTVDGTREFNSYGYNTFKFEVLFLKFY